MNPTLHSELQAGRTVRVDAGWLGFFDHIFTGKIVYFNVERDGSDIVSTLKCTTIEYDNLNSYMTFDKDAIGFQPFGMVASDVVRRVCELWNIPIGWIQPTGPNNPYTSTLNYYGDIGSTTTLAFILNDVCSKLNQHYNLWEANIMKCTIYYGEMRQQAFEDAGSFTEGLFASKSVSREGVPGLLTFSWMFHLDRLYWMQNRFLLPNSIYLTPETGLLEFKFNQNEEGEVQWIARHLFLPHVIEGMTVRIMNAWASETDHNLFKVVAVHQISDETDHVTELLLEPVEVIGGFATLNPYGTMNDYNPWPAEGIGSGVRRPPDYAAVIPINDTSGVPIEVKSYGKYVVNDTYVEDID